MFSRHLQGEEMHTLRSVPHGRFARVLSVFIVCLFGLFLGGCPGPLFVSDPASHVESPPTPKSAVQDMSLPGQALRAWNKRDMPEAERLYGIIARNPQSTGDERLTACERLAAAAVVNRHPRSALEALELWRGLAPDALRQPAWQDAWGQSLMQVGGSEAIRAVERVWNDTSNPVPLRGMAGSLHMVRASQDSENMATRLNALYESVDTNTRIELERRTHALLNQADDTEITRLSSLSGPSRDHLYPWTVILLEELMRETLRGGPRSAELAGRLGAPGAFADPGLLGKALHSRREEYIPPDSGGLFNAGCTALILPLSGPYAPIGRKVAVGAEAAGQVLSQSGHPMRVEAIDTESTDWLQRLNELPAECVTVGGPLRSENYAQARSAGLTSTRVFFTFFSALDEGEEGSTAWRFFSSPNDQISSLLRFTARLGVSAYGILMPDEPYGRRMSELFSSAVQAGGGAVKLTSYTPGSSANWSKLMSGFVGAYMRGKTPMSSATFQAAFFPDSWQNIESMVPYLFYHGEDRLILMGTSIWEQTLSSKQRNNIENMDLAVFPGIWNPAAGTPAAASLVSALARAGQSRPDAWHALGFDFVRFASALNMNAPGWMPQQINERIATAQNIDWSMAPLRWNQGRAAQALHLFQPTATGYRLVDEQAFKKRLDEIRARYVRRRR